MQIHIPYLHQNKNGGYSLRLEGTARQLAGKKTHPLTAKTIWEARHEALHFFEALESITPATAGTFGNLSEKWLDSLSASTKTIANHRTHLRFWISGGLEEKLLHQITPALLRGILDAGSDLKDGTKAIITDTLRLFFNNMIEQGFIAVNPASILRIKRTTPNIKTITPEQRKRLQEAAHSLAMPQIALMIDIAVMTALRKGDILNLEYDNIVNGYIDIIQEKTRNRLIQPLGQRLLSLLDSHGSTGRVILRDGKPYSKTQFNYDWDKVRRAAGLESVNFKDLRATAAALRKEVGESTASVAEHLGHTADSTATRYYVDNTPTAATADEIEKAAVC